MQIHMQGHGILNLLWLQNTISLTLDDTKGFKETYFKCQCHLYYWRLYNSWFHVRYGDWLLFTTLICDTFYYVLHYKRRYIAFVIEAITTWLIGFCTKNGFFQVKSLELEGLYMDSAYTKVLHFNGNHKSISPNVSGSTVVNIYAI